MSERKPQQKFPHKKNKIPNPNLPNCPRKKTIQLPLKSSKKISILQRCKSEPILFGFIQENEIHSPQPGIQFLRRHTCYDFDGPFLSQSYSNSKKYENDAKVVVNVSVEGSPGPLRALVPLGASVEQTIKLVIDKYSDEGRRPYLDKCGTPTEFDLHLSHFSLESIKKTDKIGEVGSRSFYLRKKNGSFRSTNGEDKKLVISESAPDQIVHTRSITSTHHHHEIGRSSIVFFQSFIARKMSKIGRRTRRFWSVLLGCG